MNKDKLDLSIVIPAYNEQPNLYSTFKDIVEYLKTKTYSYEVIVVDDGSTDKTAEIASLNSNLFQSFRLLKNLPNRGKGYSVKKGVLAAQGDCILFMDADNSTRINQLEKLMPSLKKGYDVVIASRRIPGAEVVGSQPLYRIILGNIYIILSKLIVGATVMDYNCGFKLYTKKAANLLFSRLTMDNWSFDSELIFLIYKFKLRVKEVPIKWKDERKTSKVRPLRDGINSFLSLIIIRLNAFKKFYD